ncbi:hypothetical protein K8R61_01210, partial [bacterium]|nr:hypothetical protein [bacterium]
MKEEIPTTIKNENERKPEKELKKEREDIIKKRDSLLGVDKNIKRDEQIEKSTEDKEINFKETPEYKKMKRLDSKIFFLSNHLSKDKIEEYRNKTYYIVKEEIIAENPEELKKIVRDKIVKLEEIKKEIEEDIEKENEFNGTKKELEKENVNSEIKTLPDSFENNPIEIKSEETKLSIIVGQEKPEEQKALPGNFENNPIAIKSEKTDFPVIIEQEKSAEQIIDNDIRAMLNTAKIRIENADNPEEMEKKLEQAVFAQSKGVRENEKLMEKINDILGQISENNKFKADEKETLKLTRRVSEITGIEKEKIIQIIKNQESKIKERAEQELYSGSFKKKLAIAGARWGTYIGLGAGVGALTVATGGTAGVFGGSALAGIRMAEGAITAKISGKKLKEIESELKKQLKENQAEKDKFLTDIIAEIALNKQEEIDGHDEEKQTAENNLKEKRETYLKKGKGIKEEKKKETEEYQEYLKAVNCLKENYEKSLSDYLDKRYPYIDQKEKEACVSAMLVLFQNEENTELLKQEFFKKGFLKKGIDKIQKVLDNKWLGGKDTIDKKLRTSAVFAFSGYLARQSNTVRRILFTFAGAKAGSAIADKVIKNIKKYNVLNQVKAKDLTEQEEISDDLFNRTKTQLMDDNFKKENPSEYAKLREEVEKIEKEKILQAEKAEQLMADNNEKLKNKILEKKQAKKDTIKGRVAMQALGAGAGFFLGELFVHSTQAKINIENDTDGQVETKGGANATEDNEMQGSKEQKPEKILEEKQEIKGTETITDLEIKQKLESNLSIFCKENDIDFDKGEKLSNRQGVK